MGMKQNELFVLDLFGKINTGIPLADLRGAEYEGCVPPLGFEFFQVRAVFGKI